MTTPTRSRVTYRNEPEWTPRQREVLDLLVRNRTNSQIAETLGISLDGAKWHVSEIITKLGVETRDEAAEYWRARNGLRMRFTRVLQGLFGGTGLKVTAGVAAVGAVGIATVFALVVILNRGEGEDTEIVSPPPPANADPGVNPTSAPNTVTSPVLTGEVVDGVAVKTLAVGTPMALPKDLVVIIERGCWGCDGPASSYERLTADASGAIVRVPLFTAPGQDTAAANKPYISSASFDRPGQYYVGVCSRGYCGALGQPTADAQTTIYRSTDGGISWVSVRTYDGAVTIAMVQSDGVVLDRSTDVQVGTSSVTKYLFEHLETGKTLGAPAEGAHPSDGDRSTLAWVSPDGRKLTAADGSLIFDGSRIEGIRAGSRVQLSAFDPRAGALVRWNTGDHGQNPYLGLVKNGKLEAVFATQFQARLWLNDTTIFGNADLKESDVVPGGNSTKFVRHPVVVDLAKGTMTPLELYGPVFGDGYGGRNTVRAVIAGPALTVTNASDCLNVRETASTSAKTLGCYKDGVLLKDRAKAEQAGGINWWAVATPDGREGWASSEFLRR